VCKHLNENFLIKITEKAFNVNHWPPFSLETGGMCLKNMVNFFNQQLKKLTSSFKTQNLETICAVFFCTILKQ